MCSKCFDNNYFQFESQSDFEIFDKELALKLNDNFEVLKPKESYKQVHFDQYQCLNCKTIWNLSIPENAWRGFFLDNESLKPHIDNFKKEDRRKGIVGCLIGIIIIGLIIYLILK